jgi:methylated-DNA-[protein]-cysteine S-methyltransferase
MSEQIFALELIDTPTGPMLIVTDEAQRVRAVEWEDHEPRFKKLMQRHYGTNGVELRTASQPSPARQALLAYFAGDLHAVDDLVTMTNGTEFQRRVWDALRRIPAGETLSYGALAKQIGQPTASRAVGLANGANPIPIIVPCHRVVGADRSLTGFGGGIERKRWLLAHEARHGAAAAPLVALAAS